MKIQRTDYLLHFLCGCLISFVFWGFGWWWSLGMVALFAGGKEAYDAITKKGTPEVVDFLSTLAGFPVVALIETIKSIGNGL